MNEQTAERFRPSQAWVRALRNIGTLPQSFPGGFPQLIDSLADQHGARPALRGPSDSLTFRELAALKNSFAAWAHAQGVGAGCVVGLLMHNSPRYLAAWAGIIQAGATASLLNIQLRGAALAHCIAVSSARHVITDVDLVGSLESAVAGQATPIDIWLSAPGTPCGAPYPCVSTPYDEPRVSGTIARVSVSMEATALLIFTSGTTGLPKAARISHYRILEWSLWFAGMMDAGPGDVLYNCLPMYHSTGGVAALGGALAGGATVVVRPRFSARGFWQDIVAERCTMFLYIGELCRYLLAAPEQPLERGHLLRLCCGNGLQADIWERFAARFQIPRILEFYASTEGNVSLYNCEAKPGSIGRIPPYLRQRFPVALIACDPDTGEAIRDPQRRCVRCGPGEAGEAIGKIPDGSKADPAAFDGYTDPAATERKVLRSVFTPGDAWFRTGDLMRQDAAGFYYFIDRLGDTFRWKGENVSTTEVANALKACPGVTDCIVYGVAVPGQDGRCGMAAIVTGAGFSLQRLHAHIACCLPAYARPVFIRVCAQIETTATHKPVKARLAREAYDPEVVSDPILVADDVAGTYRPRDLVGV